MNLRAVALAAAAAILLLPACGGGGNGNPAAPPGNPPGQGSGNVLGSVSGQASGGTRFTGTEVRLAGVGTTTVDANNEFSFENVSSGVRQLELSGSNHLTRRVDINVTQSGVNRFGIELVETAGFDLAAFDEIYRDFQVEGTVRWNRRPTRVVLDRQTLGALPQGLGFFEAEVRRAYTGWLPANTGGFFSGTPVSVGNTASFTSEGFDCSDVPDGEVHIVGVDECPVEEMFINLGSATHCFNTVGNEVVLAAIFFNPCTTSSTVEHEVIHTLCASHLESRPNASIMGSPGGARQILPIDRRHMRYLYSRPAGTLSPDDSRGLSPLTPG
jgi:hypothetical protein